MIRRLPITIVVACLSLAYACRSDTGALPAVRTDAPDVDSAVTDRPPVTQPTFPPPPDQLFEITGRDARGV